MKSLQLTKNPFQYYFWIYSLERVKEFCLRMKILKISNSKTTKIVKKNSILFRTIAVENWIKIWTVKNYKDTSWFLYLRREKTKNNLKLFNGYHICQFKKNIFISKTIRKMSITVNIFKKLFLNWPKFKYNKLKKKS